MELKRVSIRYKYIDIHYTFIHILFWIRACCTTGFASYYLSAKGFNLYFIGLAVGCANLCSIVIQPFLASFTDRSIRFRIKHIISILSVISILCSCLLVFLNENHKYLFISLYIFILLAVATEVPLLSSLSSEHILSGTKIRFSLARGIGSLSFAVTSLIFGKLSSLYGANITMPIYIAFTLIYLILILLFICPAKIEAIKLEDKSKSIKEFITHNKQFVFICLSIFLIFNSAAFLNSYFYQVIENVGGNSASLGVCLFIAASVELLSMSMYERLAKKFNGHINMLKIAAIFFLVKILITYFATNIYTIYFAQLLQFFSFGIYVPASVFYVNEIIPKQDQVKGQMIINIAPTFAMVFASFVGGAIITSIGIQKAMMYSIILTLIGNITLNLFSKNKSRKF